jgi:pimeloyl-ACP methyl ester carboxylesterase
MPQFRTDDDVTLVYEDQGPRSGIPVVFCHGLASSERQHLADAEYFAGMGYRVLVPSVRGHGRSGKPRTMSPAAFTVARMAADLGHMLDHANVGPVHWVGNSLGGILGLQLLGTRPAHFASFATFGTPYSLHLPRWMAQVIPWAHRVFGRRAYSRMAGIGMSRDPATQRFIASVVEDWDPQVGLLIAQHLTQLKHLNLIDHAVDAEVPILMIRGGQDPQINIVLGPTLRALRGRPNFTLVDLPKGGHCANLDAPHEVRAEILQFWRRAQVSTTAPAPAA